MKCLMFKEVEDVRSFIDLMRDLEAMGFSRIDGKPVDYFMDFVNNKHGVIVTHDKKIILVEVTRQIGHLFDNKYLEY